MTSSYEIAESVGISQREVGFAVARARKDGKLIGSVHGEGYYIIETEDELADTIGHIAARKRGIDKTISALRKSWGRHAQGASGQLSMIP